MRGGGCVRKTWMAIIAVFLLAVLIPPVWSQDVSKKKDLAVFNLYYSSFSIPYEVLDGIDEEIKNVFINLVWYRAPSTRS
jgi:hypothetical protein